MAHSAQRRRRRPGVFCRHCVLCLYLNHVPCMSRSSYLMSATASACILPEHIFCLWLQVAQATCTLQRCCCSPIKHTGTVAVISSGLCTHCPCCYRAFDYAALGIHRALWCKPQCVCDARCIITQLSGRATKSQERKRSFQRKCQPWPFHPAFLLAKLTSEGINFDMRHVAARRITLKHVACFALRLLSVSPGIGLDSCWHEWHTASIFMTSTPLAFNLTCTLQNPTGMLILPPSRWNPSAFMINKSRSQVLTGAYSLTGAHHFLVDKIDTVDR
jgi:hypothetical protein